ncbi:MAG: 3-dehydroquinate synthase [Planctomycetaceae bacterium]|nr:3-dehydroquinate synthase [Planctomycetaceae bacterium]
MDRPLQPGSLDVPFNVPFTHRLRFTNDVLGADENVLIDLLESSDNQPARVQFWMDRNLANANPEIELKLKQLSGAYPDRIKRVGNIQFVPGGEEIKNDIQVLEKMLKVFNVSDLDRRSYIVVIGGGAVLDTVGFAAGIAHRGIRLIRLPTTTLAQADSGLGVKNGVNLFRKKNWLGTFAVPWGVINDAEMLSTLSNRDFIAGFSEAVKVSLLKDTRFFNSLCRNAAQVAERHQESSLDAIRQSAQLHLDHITQGGDPFEMLEARPLDFGHWSAHKLESMSDFVLRHGEAVAIGVAIDAVYSSLALGLPTSDADRILRCLSELGFSLTDPALHDVELLFDGLEEFRQHLGGRLTLTMLPKIGEPVEVHQINRELMVESITKVRRFAETNPTFQGS